MAIVSFFAFCVFNSKTEILAFGVQIFYKTNPHITWEDKVIVIKVNLAVVLDRKKLLDYLVVLDFKLCSYFWVKRKKSQDAKLVNFLEIRSIVWKSRHVYSNDSNGKSSSVHYPCFYDFTYAEKTSIYLFKKYLSSASAVCFVVSCSGLFVFKKSGILFTQWMR